MQPSAAGRYQWVILALVMLAQFLPPLVLFSLGALAPLLRDALALSHGQIGFLAALFSISAGLFAIPSGWGADKLGVRVLLSAVQAVGGLALVAAAWLRTYHELCLVMLLAGMTFTTVLVITSKAIAEWFPRTRRAAAMGAKSAALAGAGVVAGAVVPPLAWGVGWRQAFALMGGLMLASACCALLLYRDRPQATPPLEPCRRQLASGLYGATAISGGWRSQDFSSGESNTPSPPIWRCSSLSAGACLPSSRPAYWPRPMWGLSSAVCPMAG
jgi:MFS family permease